MNRIFLIGDSIRMGYCEHVKGLMADCAEVIYPKVNCRSSQCILMSLFDWSKLCDTEKVKIVHFNCGHWDLCDLFGDGTFSTEEEYVENIVRIARILKSFCDVVIFATTTPVLDANPYNKNSTICRFNEIAVEALKKEGVVINDLHALLADDKGKYILASDNIHLTSEGVEVCARAVANIVAAEAKKLG